jgi:hypothetical protein
MKMIRSYVMMHSIRLNLGVWILGTEVGWWLEWRRRKCVALPTAVVEEVLVIYGFSVLR